jgi:hypothetical protein
LDGVDDELGTDVVGNRPAHDSAAEGVEDHGQVHLAVAGGVFGDVHHPQAVRSSGVELAADEIIARLAAVATCAAASSRTVDPRDAGLAHQPLDPLARTAGAQRQAELVVHPRAAIGPSGHAVDLGDGVGEDGVVPVAVTARLGPPCLEPGSRHLHHSAAHPDGKVLTAPSDEGVGHFGRTFSRAM